MFKHFDRFNCWLRGWVWTLLDWECVSALIWYLLGRYESWYADSGHIIDLQSVPARCIDCDREFQNIEPEGDDEKQ